VLPPGPAIPLPGVRPSAMQAHVQGPSQKSVEMESRPSVFQQP
jgi:hypothetical protein